MEGASSSASHSAGQTVMAAPAVPQASYHIEVSSGDGAAEAAAPSGGSPRGGGGGGGARSVVLVRRGSGSGTSPADGCSVKYVLTGLSAGQNGAGASPVSSPAASIAGKTTSAGRARQILKKRLDLSLAEKKYTKLLHPEAEAADGDGDGDGDGGEPQSASTPVMICEPETDGGAQKPGRTFFFVAKPPTEVVVKKEGEAAEGDTEAALLPDGPAPAGESPADQGVLKRLTKYRLSERYEILPAASLGDAEEVIHRLRLQNLALKTELVRQATEYERHGDEFGLRARRGRKKATTIVAVDRLRELEKIEAGMHSLFTPSQVKALSRDYKKNSVQWRDEDFRRALGLLEASSLRAFNYVRKEMNVPLPSVGTLKLRCPQQPELHVRLEAALQEGGGGEARCKHCSRRVSAPAAAASQGAAGDGAEAQYQEVQPAEQQVRWSTNPTPTRGVMKRRRPKAAAAGRKAARADEEVVFFEAPPAARGKARRGGGQAAGAVSRGRGRPGLAARYEQEEEEDEEPEDEEDDFEDFDEEVEEEVEVDPLQREVPVQFAQFRSPYAGGWSEWDPRQLQ